MRARFAMLGLLGLRRGLFRARLFGGDVLRFPPRASSAVWIIHDPEDGWLVRAHAHAWPCASREQAVATAQWLAKNWGLPIREAPP
jgi:hypothetical protein